MRPPGRLIDVGGFKLHLHCAGAGTPAVVFDAALGGSSVSWTLVQPEVARVTRACVYDRAGFGWSEIGPLPRTAGRVADELRVLLDRGEVPPPFVLVGHSFGGLVMRVFAHRYREDVSALVLVDPAHPEDWVEPAPKEQVKIDRGVEMCAYGATAARLGIARIVAALAGAGAVTLARRIVRMASRGVVRPDDEGILAPLWKLPPAARRPLKRFWTRTGFFEALGSQIGSISISAREALDAARGGYDDLPLVTISSANPSQHRLRQQEALVGLSTRGRHVIAPTSGHWIPLDEPELVIAVIRDLVQQPKRSA